MKVSLPDHRLVIAQQCELVSLVAGLDISAWEAPTRMFSESQFDIPAGSKGIVVAFHGTGYSRTGMDYDTMKMVKEEEIMQVQVMLEDGRLLWVPSKNVKGL